MQRRIAAFSFSICPEWNIAKKLVYTEFHLGVEPVGKQHSNYFTVLQSAWRDGLAGRVVGSHEPLAERRPSWCVRVFALALLARKQNKLSFVCLKHRNLTVQRFQV